MTGEIEAAGDAITGTMMARAVEPDHGVLHFEGGIWNTLPELALRPGALTRRYIHGERAKFVPQG